MCEYLLQDKFFISKITNNKSQIFDFIISLLSVQYKEIETNKNDFLKITQFRIITISLINQILSKNDKLQNILNIKDFLNPYADIVVAAYNDTEQKIKLNILVSDVFLDFHSVLPLALIINELTYNAYNNILFNSDNGHIDIQLEKKR